jgi:hypothetical protein
MTTEEARKLLGDEVDGISDEVFEKEIETAILLKNIFFNLKKRQINHNCLL